ncbi:DUF4007 family protein [Variovorax saccharolyticus]|uniref:DUF4007 family protein n=1 Tax=Variovorax saccharolyticus TaxID=3053516 RepID=UPI0025764164|nr:DUF4007 family protein [Variovorax sp. J31P216]MDM0025738.1 DUF4007 family protein [Variovorax sp. J31P216]
MIPLPPNTRPQFSGHETFPLRQLWLRKAYDAVAAAQSSSSAKAVFADDAAIARFGVGKNMVTSMRFWATACQIIREDSESGGYGPADLGKLLFDPDEGLDPFCERPGTTWLMHWILASTPEKTTTWYYIFNHVVQQGFDREAVVGALSGMIAEHGLRISVATLKRDVECCIRSYVPRAGGDSPEEMSEPLLGELGLIQQNAKGALEFRRGSKRSLPDGVFAYALLDYWQRLEHAGSVMAFDRVAHDYGSPGRVFKLDENSVADRLIALERLSRGQLQWTEQAGIRQVTRTGAALQNIQSAKMNLLKAAYGKK